MGDEAPIGQHRMRVSCGSRREEATLLVSPATCWAPRERELGVMLPLYAMRAERSMGIATYSDLGRAAAWAGGHGAGLFGTLPLLATFLDEPFDPSPYAPVSRERWSELFVDVFATPEYAASARVRETIDAMGAREAVGALAAADLVDYAGAWGVARAALGVLAEAAFASDARLAEIERAAREDEGLVKYAAFRAWCAAQGGDWPAWREACPERSFHEWMGDGAFRVFLYAQVVAAAQMESAQREAEGAGGGLYLDLPVGGAAGGFDTWRDRDAYAMGFTVGAPPDAFFAHGQSWGFRAPNPAAARATGYDAMRRMLAAHMSRCSALRIDHVMMLHRLFWIPEGGEPADGVYVRYPSEEMHAVIAIESHRHRVRVIGEDLGVVPEGVEEALRDWGMLGMSVAQFELGRTRRDALPSPGRGRLACVNTHDTPLFGAYWTGADIELNRSIGVISDRLARRQARERRRIRRAVLRRLGLRRRDPAAEAPEVLRRLLTHLAGDRADILLVSVEDLWMEQMPQNIPGVASDRYPSWRRRIAREAKFMEDSGVSGMLGSLSAARRGGA